MYFGNSYIEQYGENGKKELTYKVIYENGKEVKRELVGENVIKQPKDHIVVKGTRHSIEGWATWYGPGFHGNTTACGEVFNMYALTAAHPSLPCGTRVRVTNLSNGLSVTVRINDRGPYSGGYIIDLSYAAKLAIGMGSSAKVGLDY